MCRALDRLTMFVQALDVINHPHDSHEALVVCFKIQTLLGAITLLLVDFLHAKIAERK